MSEHIIQLQDRLTTTLPSERISKEDGRVLIDRFGKEIQILPPDFYNDTWRLTPAGYVGYIALSPGLHFSILPKVPIKNLFAMLNYAYRFPVSWQKDVYQGDMLEGFYDHLANILAKLVFDRFRKGIYRSYITEESELSYLRGRLDVNARVRMPWKVNLPCEYQEHTPDVEDNQIIGWTLNIIARSGFCSSKTLGIIRNAYHALESYVTIQPFRASVCINRLYHRLNQDYQPMHALCRFFLENSGPGHRIGERNTIPFLLNMDRLFELFVSEWLKANLPEQWKIDPQHDVKISADGSLIFKIDMVLRNKVSGEIYSVLDTKYKRVDSPSTGDISQIISYADVMRCSDAILIYPAPLRFPRNEKPGQTRYRTLWFDLEKDLEQAGHELMQEILAPLSSTP